MFDLRSFEISEHNIFWKRSVISLGLFVSFGVKNSDSLFLGIMNTSKNPKIMNMKGFRVFPKLNRKVTSPKWSRIIIRSCWAILLLIFTIKMPRSWPKHALIFSYDFPRVARMKLLLTASFFKHNMLSPRTPGEFEFRLQWRTMLSLPNKIIGKHFKS